MANNSSPVMSNNTTVPQLIITDNSSLGYAVIPLVMIGTGGSLLCLWSMWRRRAAVQNESASSITLLYINLSISSLLFSGFVLTVSSYTMIMGGASALARPSYSRFCQFQAFAYFTGEGVCAFVNSAIAVNRFFVVVLSGPFPALKSRNVTLCLLAGSWLFPMLLFIWPVFGVFGSFGFSTTSRCAFLRLNPIYQTVYKVCHGLLPFGIMLVCYSGIVLHVGVAKRRLQQHRFSTAAVSRSSTVAVSRSSTAAVSRSSTAAVSRSSTVAVSRFSTAAVDLSPQPETAPKGRRRAFLARQDMQATKIAFATCLAFMICFLPNGIFGMIAGNLRNMQGMTGAGIAYWVYIGRLFKYVDVRYNPLVYVFLSSDMRKRAFAQWLFGMKG
ncbi:hypothetical protein BV898_10538 [Hypsibius exemplaris]|uniref:G-protein coupled receptors family 1 profile domain-containing protein n=1 Tax=Hypsibius exemplaris TaxID=2072580 RepID=A0A1W0WJB2_HYPEX|nr:hypothetical protein BV898_10538 [Hypsibius exemplaris]